MPRMRVRWWIFAFVLAFTFVAYPQRLAVSVAAERMMPELGLTQDQIGWLETAFLASYTALQIPTGILGEWIGARTMLSLCGGVALAGGLLAAQCVLGAAQAPLFSVMAGTQEHWFPTRQWALTQGLSSGG